MGRVSLFARSGTRARMRRIRQFISGAVHGPAARPRGVGPGSLRRVSAANPTFPFNWSIKVSTHLKKLDQTGEGAAGQLHRPGRSRHRRAHRPHQAAAGLVDGADGRSRPRHRDVPDEPGEAGDRARRLCHPAHVRHLGDQHPGAPRVAGRCPGREPRRGLVSDLDAGDGPDVRHREPHRRPTFRGTSPIQPLEHCGASTLPTSRSSPGPEHVHGDRRHLADVPGRRVRRGQSSLWIVTMAWLIRDRRTDRIGRGPRVRGSSHPARHPGHRGSGSGSSLDVLPRRSSTRPGGQRAVVRPDVSSVARWPNAPS